MSESAAPPNSVGPGKDRAVQDYNRKHSNGFGPCDPPPKVEEPEPEPEPEPQPAPKPVRPLCCVCRQPLRMNAKGVDRRDIDLREHNPAMDFCTVVCAIKYANEAKAFSRALTKER